MPGGYGGAVGSSQHPCLDVRGLYLALVIAVDDATDRVAQAMFRITEDTRGYQVLMQGLVYQWGRCSFGIAISQPL